MHKVENLLRQQAETGMTAQGGGNSEAVLFEKERGVTEVQVAHGVAHVTVALPLATLGKDRLALLQLLGRAEIPVFMVKLLPAGMSFALREGFVDAGVELMRSQGIEHNLLKDLALVSVIAGAMRDLSGVMALIYHAFVSADILVRQTGDAYNAVLCLVEGAVAERAANELRSCFFRTLTLPEAAPTADRTGLKGL